jgi:hypothetical protein
MLLLLALSAFQALARLALCIELEYGTRSRRAAHQMRRADQPRSFFVELGNESAARIGCDRSNGASLRAKAKPMQRECSLSS